MGVHGGADVLGRLAEAAESSPCDRAGKGIRYEGEVVKLKQGKKK